MLPQDGASVPHHFPRRQVIDWDQPDDMNQGCLNTECDYPGGPVRGARTTL